MEPQKVGIPILNLPRQEETSENARVKIEISVGKLKGLAPIVRNNEEVLASAPERNYEEQEVEAPESATYSNKLCEFRGIL